MEERFLVVLELMVLLVVDLAVTGAQQPDGQCNNEGKGVYLPCTFTSTKAGILKCKYTMGNIFEQVTPSLFHLPGPPPILNVAPFVVDSANGLNVTWKLPCDASTQFLQGFLLTVTFVDDQQINRTILRSFLVEVEMVEELKYVEMYYECLISFQNTDYHFELLSYPSTDSKRTTNYVTLGGFSEQEALYSYDWVAYMWANTDPDTSSITACFYTAPAEFRFDQYELTLQSKHESELWSQPYTKRFNVTVDSRANETTKICRVFTGLARDSYRILLEPVALILQDTQSCTCRQGPVGEDNCVDRCTASVLGFITLVAPDPPWPPYNPFTETTKLSPPPLIEVGKVVGIVIGAVVGAAVVFALLFVVLRPGLVNWIKRQCNDDVLLSDPCIQWEPLLNPEDLPTKIPDQTNKLLLVYFHDNARHGSVVSKLAEYLKTVCRCDLVSFPPSVPSGSSDSLHKYDLQTVNNIRTTIIVHSTGLFNYKKENPDEKIPLLAIQELERYETEFQYYHVLIPNTPKEVLLNGRGKTFQMLDQLNELVAILGGEGVNAISDRLEEPGMMEYAQLKREFQIERSFFENNNGQKMISVDSGYDTISNRPVDSGYDTISNRHSEGGGDDCSLKMYGQLFIPPSFPLYDINFIPPRTPSPTFSEETRDLEEQLHEFNAECGSIDSFYPGTKTPIAPSEIIMCDISKVTFQSVA